MDFMDDMDNFAVVAVLFGGRACHAKPSGRRGGLACETHKGEEVACQAKPSGRSVVRAEGIEPSLQAWEAHVLPIYYARLNEKREINLVPATQAIITAAHQNGNHYRAIRRYRLQDERTPAPSLTSARAPHPALGQ